MAVELTIAITLASFLSTVLGLCAGNSIARRKSSAREIVLANLLRAIVASSEYINYGPKGHLVDAHLISEARRLAGAPKDTV